ncbi:hypothetical protein AAZX31_08G135800 [Glycine max]|uniref:VQ domain-containing protein n=1 Tax=Glycine max TaxID=3847 RepID=K7L6J7_SOYBN|nr:transcription factor mef2A [Glycine max]KAG5015629.1 hypothetical protein JHK85_021765 [Glycine max]KRH43208.1 hypothetical protein GLYMA_08G137300v4 [Glycine max]|eukprot:XP_014634430.1 transcription factor mef2A [Glycine max]
MDSANTSGSLQSSSGADEEYDSRAESSPLSMFLTNQPQPQPPPSQVAPFIPPPHQQLQHHQNTHMFDPLSNYLDPIPQSSASLLNLDVMWSKQVRSEPNQTDLVSLIPHNQAFVSSQTRGNNSGAFPTLPPESGSRGLMLSVSAANNDQIQTHTNNSSSNMVRNPKKRSRASRRAPTTVLTTDTTNFRAMVQEFTGIPAQPFTSSSFPRTRLDLFASAATPTLMRSNVNVNPLDPPTQPPYLLRPFAQKLQLRSLHPFPPSFSNTFLPPSTNSSTNSTSINYQQQQQQLSEHFGFVKQPLNFNNTTPDNSTLEAYHQLKHHLGNSSSVLVSRTQQHHSLEIPPNLKNGVFEELGLRHDHVNTDLGCLHQSMVSSTSVGVGALSSGNNNNNNLSNATNSSTEWAQRTGTITNNDCDHGGGGALSGTINYSDTNGKVHYSASSSDFHGEKGPDFTVTATRTQGMVESWINCSSD